MYIHGFKITCNLLGFDADHSCLVDVFYGYFRKLNNFNTRKLDKGFYCPTIYEAIFLICKQCLLIPCVPGIDE